MARPPRRPDAPVLRRVYVVRICLVSAFTVAGAFWLFAFVLERGHAVAEARTATANLFVVTETLYLFNCRSLTAPFWRNGLLSNRWACLGAAAMLVAQIAVTHVAPLARLFGNVPIGFELWAAIFALALTSFVGVELHKWWDRRRALG
jgi:cation-transporting ATPase F